MFVGEAGSDRREFWCREAVEEAVRERFPNLPKGVRTACLRGTDHFFRGRLDALEALVEETAKAWLKESH